VFRSSFAYESLSKRSAWGEKQGGPQAHSELGSVDFWNPSVWEAEN